VIVETQDQLKKIITSEKEKGRSVLIKKGVFDIIHPGHIYAISEFKKKSDIVIILLQSDEFTRLKKGTKRPINQQNQRALVVDGIKDVDYVFLDKSLSRNEYIETLNDLQPSILAVTSTDKEKTKAYSGHGWELVEFPDKKKPGFSTTEIIEAVRKNYSN
jgi:glycerol-3-phosphate cytidylyltransferase